MKKERKRWMALLLVVVMVMALLPESFLSAVRVRAEDIETSAQTVKLQFNAPEGTTLENANFSFVLYEGNGKEKQAALIEDINHFIEQSNTVPNGETPDSDELEEINDPSDENGTESVVITAEKTKTMLTVAVSGLKADTIYTYIIESIGSDKYDTVENAIDLTQETNTITLQEIETSWDFNDSVTENTVSINAKTEENTVDLSSYIKDYSESLNVSYSISDENEDIAKAGISINEGKLEIPADYTGRIPVTFQVSDKTAGDSSKILYFDVQYSGISEDKLPESKDTVIYSNESGYQPELKNINDARVYAISKTGTTVETKFSNIDTTDKITDGIIKIKSGITGEQYYDIYMVDSENNISKAELTLNVDTVGLKLEISYEDTGKTAVENDIYYQGRTATVKANKSSQIIDPKELKTAIVKSISELFIVSETPENGIYTVTDETGNEVLEISEWDDTECSYKVEFAASGKYTWNDIDYTDKAGHKAETVFPKIENTTADCSFTIDHSGPEADCFINIFEDVTSDVSNSYPDEKRQSNALKLATNSSYGKSAFELKNIKDNYSGVTGVFYFLSDGICTIEEVSKLNNDQWETGTLDNDGTLKVTKDKSGLYYIYYKLVDAVGNISYYDGLGFELDVDAPDIRFTYTCNNSSKDFSQTQVVVNDNVDITAEITEKNFQRDENGNITGISVKVNDNALENVTVSENNDGADVTFSLEAVDKQEKKYEIIVACEDAVKHTSEIQKKTIIIDRKAPDIKIEFTEEEHLKGSYYKSRTAKITVEDEYSLDAKAVREAIIKGINASIKGSSVITDIENIELPDSVNDTYVMKGNNNTEIYKIQAIKSDASQVVYQVEFIGDADYELNISYTDCCGNEGTLAAESFTIDNYGPSAAYSVKVQKKNNEVQELIYSETVNGAQISTTQNNNISQFILSDIEDNFSDITVYYHVGQEGYRNEEAVKKSEAEEENFWEEVEESNITNHTFTYSLSSEDKSGDYYICYKLVDMAGNITYISENLGIRLDNTFPEISDYTFTNPTNNSKVSAKGESDESIPVFDQSVKVNLQIKEENFDADNVIVTVSDNETAADLTDQKWAYSETWSKDIDSDLYTNSVTLPGEDGKAHTYVVTVECTDKAGLLSSREETIIIDKEAPVIKLQFTEGSDQCINKDKKYYRSRTAIISVLEPYSFDKDKFEEAVKKAISSEVSLSEYDSGNGAYTYAVKIEFAKDNEYRINDIEYTDLCGNSAVVEVDTENGDSFIIDNTAPTAKASLELYKYGDSMSEIVNLNPDNPQDFKRYLSTSFTILLNGTATDGFSKFVLSDIQDNLTGVKSVEYYLADEQIIEIPEAGWVSEGATLSEQKYILSEKEKTGNHYIYYRLTDGAGNISYYNGAGISLDQDNPEIEVNYQYLDGSTAKSVADEFTENVNAYTFSNNIKICFTINEANFDAEQTKVTVEKYNFEQKRYEEMKVAADEWKVQKEQATATSFISMNTDNFSTEQGEADQYKISVETTDQVGRSSLYTEIIRIDRENPVITVEYDDSEKVKDSYYKGNRTAKITVEKSFRNSISERDFLDAVKNGIYAKDGAYQKITDVEKYYEISEWDEVSQGYIVTFQEDAIYEVKIVYQDKAGNESETVRYNPEVQDGSSFVIDTQAPEITVAYTDTGKVTDYYYNGKRTADIEVTDLSFTYAYYESKDFTPITDKLINMSIQAENPLASETVSPEILGWSYENGKFKTTVTYSSDAIYTFGINGQDICWNTFTNEKYVDAAGQKISDGQSFVIDTQVPDITVIYDDTNKQTEDFENGYYNGERKLKISFRDLSLYYAKNIRGQENSMLNNYITWNISAENETGANVEKAYTTDAEWIFHEEENSFDLNICYSEDAIYTFSVSSVRDICQNVSGENEAIVSYRNEAGNKIEDGESFVIDTKAPVITVSYDDTNKKQDYFYEGERTAEVTIADLSFVYAQKSGNQDVLTGKSKINWQAAAWDAAEKEVDGAFSRTDEWRFDAETGTFIQRIEFTKDAIYSFSISADDFCRNAAEEENVIYENNIADGRSFVIDTKSPEITVVYDDSESNQLKEHYYFDTRTAVITVDDLSYLYEEQRKKAAEEAYQDFTADHRISLNITAQNAASASIADAYECSDWTFHNGVYQKTVRFIEDGIYHFSMQGDDIYGREAGITYQNKSDEQVKDWESFVISRAVPEVKVTYDDNEQNKLQEHYFMNTRTAFVTVSDLSFLYEDSFDKEEKEEAIARVQIEIDAEAADGSGEADAYTVENWKFVDGVYQQKITFEQDAIYTWSVSGNNIYGREIHVTYQNGAGEEITDYDSFVIDREAPRITVTYDDTNKAAGYYQDNFYKGVRTAEIAVSDLSYVYEDRRRAEEENSTDTLTSDTRVYTAVTAVDESDYPVENAYEISDWSLADGIYTAVITYSSDAIYSCENSARDIYGREAEFKYENKEAELIKDWDSFVIDTKTPDVTVTYDDSNKGTNGKYADGFYTGTRTASITVSDLSFVYADRVLHNKEAELALNEGNYIQRMVTAHSFDTDQDVENAYAVDSWNWNTEENGYQTTVTFTEEAHFTFDISGEDICENIADVSYSGITDANDFVIDKTAPTISITYDDNSPVRIIDGRGYFASARTAVIVITEGHDTFDADDATENIVITAKNAAGQAVAEESYTISSWTESKASQNGNATTYTAAVFYKGNANYDFSISYTDKTGHTASDISTNDSTVPYTFTVDRQDLSNGSPTGTVSISGFGSWNYLAELLTFDRWSASALNVTAAASDEISSVYSIKYYKTSDVTAKTRQQLMALSTSSWTDYSAFTVKPDERFTVYLRVEDRSGNIAFVSSNGMIADSTAPGEEKVAPEITVSPAQPVNGIYSTNVTVDISVTDPVVNDSYSGLKSIRYEVLNMGAVTQEGQLYTFNYVEGKTLQSQLLQQWNGKIVVDRNLNNSNDVKIIVYAQDNSGNSSNASTAVQIDVTQPSIEVSYDNNSGDSSFGSATYFKENRTATIKITERNFNPNDVQITITNTDGVIPALSGWTTSAGTGNGDDTVHTATILYSADGDYVFHISYADMAGNGNTEVNYGNTVAPEQFTIDKTLPVISVSYDNNSVLNGNYYSAARTATISINEHNFDAGRYTVSLIASDDGAAKTAPSIGGWSSNGDIHTASIQFADDGYYTMTMSYTDMAGNQAAQFVQQTFFVDKTMPRVTVKGIKNNTANNAETIGFEITCTDTNFDIFTPVLKVTRVVNGKNVVETCDFDNAAATKNGMTYTVQNLVQDGIYSLTCIAEDKAGNNFDKVIYLGDAGQEESSMDAASDISFLNFSVNREGSAYMLENYADTVAASYYIKEVDDDIVIVETNVDKLENYTIELNGRELVEGTDYTIETTGGDGEWYVVRYIISRALFAEEGEYKLVIASRDLAGNAAYSDIKGTNMSFVVDKTAPVVTVSGVESDGRYQVESQTVTVIPKDDGGKLQKIMIEVLHLDGSPVDGFPVIYEGEELLKLLEDNHSILTFELPQGTGMSVRITCVDAAGNEMDVMEFDNIVVSTSGFTIFMANKPLFYGTIAGIIVLVGLMIVIIVWKRRKKQSDKEEGGSSE